jgi:DeoR/GlpR family transcriptional regulator of sugar metabolism
LKTQRQNDIIRLLANEVTVKTDDLVHRFGVSIETIRRDIRELKRQNLISTFYGGIGLRSENQQITEDFSWQTRLGRCSEEKKRIVRRALDFIPDRATIALDIGTTIFELAHILGGKQELTIITNSIKIAGELSQNTHHDIYTTGGRLHKDQMITTGSFARSFLDNFISIDLFVCSADGISFETGITEFSEGVVDVKKKFAALSQRTIVLADHSKFGKRALFQSCASNNINIIITDNKTPRSQLEEFSKNGARVVIAE